MMCLVCPELECPYFGELIYRGYIYEFPNFSIVNVSELMNQHQEDVLSIKDTNLINNTADSSGSGQYIRVESTTPMRTDVGRSS